MPEEYWIVIAVQLLEAGKRNQYKTLTSTFFRAIPADIRLDLLPWYTTGFL